MKDLKFVLFKRMLGYLMHMCEENATAVKQIEREERDYHINKALMWKHKAEYIIGIIEECEKFLIRLNNNFKETTIEVVEFRIIKPNGDIEITDIDGLFDTLND